MSGSMPGSAGKSSNDWLSGAGPLLPSVALEMLAYEPEPLLLLSVVPAPSTGKSSSRKDC